MNGAVVAELADAPGSGPGEGNLVGVQVPPTVPEGRGENRGLSLRLLFRAFTEFSTIEYRKKPGVFQVSYSRVAPVAVRQNRI